LKIDRSFISGLGWDKNSLYIVETIVTLAGSLEVDVIGEGVETEEQLAGVRALGRGYAQGYLFSRPVGGEAAGVLIAEGLALAKGQRG
jgi:EAL domain-containing protein (putative c-di-GMP-specific phosphodiesterase class I)